MEALKKKLNSSRGASILLAMLFMLLCVLVAASVVMAASSNLGKTKSNREEQQKYLTLSSAMNMLIDELESVEYVGQYEYEYKYSATNVPINPDDPEPDLTDPTQYYTREDITHSYKLTEGKWQWQNKDADTTANPTLPKDDWGTDTNKQLNALLPLNKYLDGLYGEKFKTDHADTEIIDKISDAYWVHYDYNCYLDVSDPEYTLTFTVNDSAAPGDLFKQAVKIEVKLEDDGRIFLTGTLRERQLDEDGNTTGWSDTDYQMVAMLRTTSGEWPVKELILKTHTPADYTQNTKDMYTFNPVRWELSYIYKVEV